MKKTKLIFGTLLLFAAVGAYASTQNRTFTQAFYISGSSCLPYGEIECTEIGSGCEEFVEGLGTVPLYKTVNPEAGQPCIDPLDRETK